MNPFNLKNFLLCSIILLITGSGIGQKNWCFEVDGGYTSVSKAEMTGYGFNANLGRYINKRLYVAAGFQHHRVESDPGYYLAKAEMNSGHLLIGFDVIKTATFSLDIAPMGFYRSRDQSFDVEQGYSVATEGYFIDENKSLKYNVKEYGYGGKVGIKYTFYKQLGLKLDGSFQRDLNDIDIITGTLGLYIRF